MSAETLELVNACAERVKGAPILIVLAGSHGHGFNIEGSDQDRHGVFVASTTKVLSLAGIGQETHEWKDALGDVTLHEIGKFLRLCLKGNPTALNVLWFDPIHSDSTGRMLTSLRKKVLWHGTLKPFLGYARDQLRRLDDGMSVHGKGGKPSGKWAAHVLRILWQGLELAETGDLIVKFNESQTKTLLDVRSDAFPLDAARAMALEFIDHLEEYVDGNEPSPLPKEPDTEYVDDFLRWVRVSWLEMERRITIRDLPEIAGVAQR